MEEKVKRTIGTAILILSPMALMTCVYIMDYFQNIIAIGLGVSGLFAWVGWGVSWATYVDGID